MHPSSIQDISKDIAAFANTEGGHIIVGVEDNGTVIGVDWNAEKSRLVYGEGMNCSPQISVTIHPVRYPRVGTVVAIEVPKSTYIHRDSMKRFPQRLGDSTVFMDTAMLLSLARSKTLIGQDGQLNNPFTRTRQRPKRVAFLMDYLSDPNPVMRTEAITDIGNVSWNYQVEGIAGFNDKMNILLKDEASSVKLATLETIGNIHHQLDSQGKRLFASKLQKRIIDLVLHDKDIEVRTRAYVSLCAMGDKRTIEVILELIRTEPPDTYGKMNVVNNFLRVVEAGHGYDLRRALYQEMSKEQKVEMRGRIQVALVGLRNVYWSR